MQAGAFAWLTALDIHSLPTMLMPMLVLIVVAFDAVCLSMIC